MFNDYSAMRLDFENVLLDLKGYNIILVPLTPNMIWGYPMDIEEVVFDDSI